MPGWWRNWTLRIYETPKFQKQRKKLRSDLEKTALRETIRSVAQDPSMGKKLKGEFKDLRSLRYFAEGQEKRIICKVQEDLIYLLSFSALYGNRAVVGLHNGFAETEAKPEPSGFPGA